ncbi:Ankyrin_repeat-containing domain superfamily [Hexamita inflata]|uniref:Ankyrin repeat-containing domain superfamily n=1 Tax=Hexamita inflata TaxID=28002 RepID=A0AA86QWR0_9EUKA|nr:Ankyrin repeat-containing domain superfamily [Hexamita inflata]
MGCQAPNPFATTWFAAVVQNDLPSVQNLRQCIGSYTNGLSALHVSLIHGSFDVFSFLLPLEFDLLTKREVVHEKRVIPVNSSILQISCILNNFQCAKQILNYLHAHQITSAPYLHQYLRSANCSCCRLISHPFFVPQLQKAVKNRTNLLSTVENGDLFEYFEQNFNEIPGQFIQLLKIYFQQNNYQLKEQNKSFVNVLKKLQKKVEEDEEFTVKSEFGDLAGSKFMYVVDE